MDPQDTRTIAWLDVQDSNNTNSTVIDCIGLNCTDSGNNTNWTFVSAGGGTTRPPILFGGTIVVNQDQLTGEGQDTVDNILVKLSFRVMNVVSVLLSNTSDFINSERVYVLKDAAWELEPSEAAQQGILRTIYAIFRSPFGLDSEVVSKSITLKLASLEEDEEQTDPEPIKKTDLYGNLLQEGDLIRGPDGIRVYIINEHDYKRHIFNPAVFGMYQHFSWNSIREVNQTTLDSYVTSDFYRTLTNPAVYQLEEINETQGTAIKHHLNITSQQFTQKGYVSQQIFTINQEEVDYYEAGGDWF